MKVLVFANLRPHKVGSYERLVAALAAAMRTRRHTLIHVVAAEPCADVAELWRSAGARWGVLPGWTDDSGGEHAWRFCVPAMRWLAREQPDVAVVEFGNEVPAAIVRIACFFLHSRTRWVWVQHQRIEPPSPLAAHLSRIRLVGVLFSAVVTLYDGGRRSLLLRHVKGSRVRLIPNAVALPDPMCSRAEIREKLGAGPLDIVAVAVGSLITRKRVGFLLEAMRSLPPKALNRARLWIVGDGPQGEDLRARAAAMGTGDKVIFLGARSDVGDVLRGADIFVHAATAEASSYAIMEAMCAGLPCIVTAAGAAAEQVLDGETGYVCDTDDSSRFASEWAVLTSDDERRLNMGRRARERWKTEFAVDLAVRRYVALYDELGRIS